jgi:hypothetical protein
MDRRDNVYSLIDEEKDVKHAVQINSRLQQVRIDGEAFFLGDDKTAAEWVQCGCKTVESKRKGFREKPRNPVVVNGADVGIRTPDLLITNQLLYQLSYIGLLSILK